MVKKMKVGLIMVLCVCLIACTQNQVLLDLDIAAAAVAAASVVPGVPPQIGLYLGDAATALDCAAAAVQKGGTNAQVALAVSLCGLSAAAPNIPGGTPQTIIALVTAVTQAISRVINDQTQVKAELEKTSVPVVGNAFGPPAGNNGSKPFKLGHGGAGKIAKIRKTLQDAKAKLPVKK